MGAARSWRKASSTATPTMTSRTLPPPPRTTPSKTRKTLARRTASRLLLAAAALAAGLTSARLTWAQAPAPTTPTAPAPPLEVRVGMSAAAAQHLSEQRVRRLLDINMGESAEVAPGPTGPL